MYSQEILSRRAEHRSQHNVVKDRCFVIENLCDKSGKVVHIKSLLNFAPKMILQNKLHRCDPYLKHIICISSEPH